MNTKRTHYRPKLYLKGFGIVRKKQTQTYVLDKSTNKMFSTSIENICVESNFFSFDEKGLSIKDKLILETGLSLIEDKIKPVLTKICDKRSLTSISTQDFCFLMEWVAWLFIARPINKHVLNSALNFAIPGYTFTNSDFLTIFSDTHMEIKSYLLKREWVLYISNERSFVTSDTTIHLAGKTLWDPVGLENALFIFFPVSPHLVLIGGLGKREGFASKPHNARKSIIEQANMLAHVKAEQFVISQSGEGFSCYLINKAALPEVTLENQKIKMIMR